MGVATEKSGAVVGASAVHHLGVSVADLDSALAFWESFLGVRARWKTRLDRPYLAAVVGIPGVSIKAAFVDLPGDVILELLEYETPDKQPNPEATANPGNIHVCLAVKDVANAWRRAIDCGARPVSAAPVEVDDGPNAGARTAYLRIHDGVTFELFQPPAA